MAVNKYKRIQNVVLSLDFKQNEFDCKGSSCGCRETLLDSKLIRKLQVLRLILGKPIVINSGYRCAAHNRAVGGASGSYHTRGMAADIRCAGFTPEKIAKAAQSIGFCGIGCYVGSRGNFVHVDVRQKRYFWRNTGSGNRTEYDFGGKFETCPYKLGAKTLQLASGGEAVKALQWMLSRCSIKCAVDGVFGEETKAALEKFQGAMLLEKDGVFGKETRRAIREALE